MPAPGRLGRGRPVPERGLRTDRIVVPMPVVDQDLRLAQRMEDLAVERLAGAAYVLNLYLEQMDEIDPQRAAALLSEALERQAALLRLFMERPDDPAEAPEQTG